MLVLETDLSYQDKCKIFHYSDLERKASNELAAIMKKNEEQLLRTKKYRKLKELYGKYSNKKDKKSCKAIAKQMQELQKQYHITWDFCRTSMIPIGKKYGLGSIFALTKAEDVWRAVEKCLYSDGRMIHFSKRGELPAIRAKQYNRGIVISGKDDILTFQFHKLIFGVKIKDEYEKEEVSAILDYLSQPERVDSKAVQVFKEDEICISTYRPCYATLVCKKSEGSFVFMCISLWRDF